MPIYTYLAIYIAHQASTTLLVDFFRNRQIFCPRKCIVQHNIKSAVVIKSMPIMKILDFSSQ